ncbi:NAD(P)H-dependent oxidoreductase [Tessaracoccus oleiagri]|uniref:Putative NADPH-quinone reductase (Modulator of drug activity B) n=1 Tax=Tessaracoccus oleiagri TaxID=686624 RepID=A0A1G9H889_9ACTN|nr:NAD(P)H-dependent oxidoreductase [Tessaracoccus oleiagri]SDL09201.1 Putative NADPH-quinone reductase (modulator of drug activity B) [Tessaracoccus oleiagri]
MTTLVIDGHPNPESLCAALAARYVAGNPSADLLAVRDLHFDPSLSLGLTGPDDLEPDLVDARQRILAASHLVVVTPTWWASMPAILKGFFDRVFARHWAYRYNPLPPALARLGVRGGIPEGLLAGRTGRLLITSDTPDWMLRLTGDHPSKVIARHILGFSGIKPVRVTRFGGVDWSDDATRAGWLAKAETLGVTDVARHTSLSTERIPAMLNS